MGWKCFVHSSTEVSLLESVLGFTLFAFIFIAMPLYYAVSILRNSSPETVPVPIDNQRFKCESPIEIRLYTGLIFRGYYVKTQVPCGKYRIDIALPQYNLAIECDGKAYHSTPEQKVHDRRKNLYLKKHGWTVLRFSGSQINGRMPNVIAAIEKKIDERM